MQVESVQKSQLHRMVFLRLTLSKLVQSTRGCFLCVDVFFFLPDLCEYSSFYMFQWFGENSSNFITRNARPLGEMVHFLQWLVQTFAWWFLGARGASESCWHHSRDTALTPFKGLPKTLLTQSSLMAISH